MSMNEKQSFTELRVICATAREWQNSNLGTTRTAVRITILLFTIYIFLANILAGNIHLFKK